MAVTTNYYLKNLFDATTKEGAKVINSDFAFEIEGYENSWILCKQAPWPEMSPTGEIEIATPVGGAIWQPQQLKVNQQGQISFYETTAGAIDNLLLDMLINQPNFTFNAKIYEGTPIKYLRYKRIESCFFQVDPIDRDWENRSQPLMFSGTLFYHYFGEEVAGNSETY